MTVPVVEVRVVRVSMAERLMPVPVRVRLGYRTIMRMLVRALGEELDALRKPVPAGTTSSP